MFPLSRGHKRQHAAMHTHTVDPTRFQPAVHRQDHFFDERPNCRAKSTIVFLTMVQPAVQRQDDDDDDDDGDYIH